MRRRRAALPKRAEGMTFEERLEALMHGLELYAAEQAATKQRLAELQERLANELAQQKAQHQAEMAILDRKISRAIRAGVQEARRQRRLSAERDAEYRAQMAAMASESDARMTRLEKSLAEFLAGLRGKNGYPPGTQ